MQVYAFAELETALQIIKDNSIDVFLANELFDIDKKSLPVNCGFAYLVESNGIQSLKNERMMIFIVTHDHRIIDYCDNIYILENHNIHLKKKIIQSNDSLLEDKMDIYSKKKSNWRYVFKSIQRNIKDLVVNYIPVSIIFMLFITIFLFLYSISINDLYEFYLENAYSFWFF